MPKVRIYQNHVHQGVLYEPDPAKGVEIDVDAASAAWLKDQGLTEKPTTKPEPAEGQADQNKGAKS